MQMACEYCDIKSEDGKSKRGKGMWGSKELTVYMYGPRSIQVDTNQDDTYAYIVIKYCPMCGRRLDDK